MTNAEIAQVFERIALILDLKGGVNPFRIRAYERGAMIIGDLGKNVRDIYDEGGLERLEKLPGIGEDLALKIEELIKTGKLKYLKDLEKKIPSGLLDIMEVEGLGPKKTKFLWKKYKVESIPKLKKLAESGKLEELKGWGKKSVENILKGIEMHKRVKGRLPLGEATEIAEEIVETLKKSKLCKDIAIAGSLRRQRDTIGDIDILVTSKKSDKIMNLFCSLPQVASVTAKGKTKSTVFLKAGLDADLRVVEPDVFGAALYYFTGSKDHNVQVRKLGIRKGLTISEYGVYRGTAKKKGKLVASRTEKDVFKSVGLPFIPPELREDRGEIKAARDGKLPKLIEEKDIKGDLHVHSDFSDGNASMVEMAKAAKAAGLSYIAFTDHASPMGMVKGLKKNNIKTYLKKIEDARKKVKGIHIISGAEVDILPDGSIYLPEAILEQLDWVVASVHQRFKDSRAQNTERILTAIRNPYVNVLAHPTTRLLGQREGIDFDMDAVIKEAKKQGVLLEINAYPTRLDLNGKHALRVKELGAKVCINSDAHATSGFDYTLGVAQARRGWLEKKDIINTKIWTQFEKWLALRTRRA